MAREDIVGGLKNAIERGENPEDAARSFINAGYNEKEVDEALRQINREMPKALEIPKRILLTEKQTSSAPSPSIELPALPNVEVKAKRTNWLLIAIGVVGFIMLSIAASLLIIMRQQ